MTEKALPLINHIKCVQCGLCVDACPKGVLALVDGSLKFVRPDKCVYCADCEAICPENAVRCEFEIRWAV